MGRRHFSVLHPHQILSPLHCPLLSLGMHCGATPWVPYRRTCPGDRGTQGQGRGAALLTPHPAPVLQVMLLGDSGVGKTCFLLQFKDRAFLSGTFIATVGIDFRNKVVAVDGVKVKLQIWDTAGQERFRSVTHAYYRDAQALLLLYDITSKMSFDNIRAWLTEIHEYAQKDVVIMLLGNKADVSSERMVRTEDGASLAREYGVPFMETSAKTGMNVELAFLAIARALSRIGSRCLWDCARIIPSAPTALSTSAQPESHGDATTAPAGRRVQTQRLAPPLRCTPCCTPPPAQAWIRPRCPAEPLALSGAPHHHVLGCPSPSAPLQLAPHMRTPLEHPVTSEGTSSTRSTLEKLCFPPLAAAEIGSFSIVIYFSLREKLFSFRVGLKQPTASHPRALCCIGHIGHRGREYLGVLLRMPRAAAEGTTLIHLGSIGHIHPHQDPPCPGAPFTPALPLGLSLQIYGLKLDIFKALHLPGFSLREKPLPRALHVGGCTAQQGAGCGACSGRRTHSPLLLPALGCAFQTVQR
uniref:small monomeric GTPase n=2 Tax=Neognathae TaxID=8825 RepID=A0A669Q181_PHACC